MKVSHHKDTMSIIRAQVTLGTQNKTKSKKHDLPPIDSNKDTQACLTKYSCPNQVLKGFFQQMHLTLHHHTSEPKLGG